MTVGDFHGVASTLFVELPRAQRQPVASIPLCLVVLSSVSTGPTFYASSIGVVRASLPDGLR